MYDVEILEDLLNSMKKITYNNREDFDVLKKRTDMLIRKFFGDDSHYLSDIKSIRFSPSIIVGGTNTDWQSPFESGIKQFRNLIQVMIDDKKLSSNYDNSKTNEFIESVPIPVVENQINKQIKILIASPGDVILERELLLDKLETKFRREHYEERCGARIIVEGWEFVASQTGYAQDIINTERVATANIILAVFRHKLGSPTIDLKTEKDRSPSGTAEELLYAIRNKLIKNKPIGMAYFYANAPVISLDSVDFKKTNREWKRLKDFISEIKNEILYKSYKSEDEILSIVCEDICNNIIKYFK